MTLAEIRAKVARLLGPQCGKPWVFRQRGNLPLWDVCDLPKDHPPGCGRCEDRTEPWFVIAVQLLAEIDRLTPKPSADGLPPHWTWVGDMANYQWVGVSLPECEAPKPPEPGPTRFRHSMGGPVVHVFASIGGDRAACGFLSRGPYTPTDDPVTCSGCIHPDLYCLEHAHMGWPRTQKADCPECTSQRGCL